MNHDRVVCLGGGVPAAAELVPPPQSKTFYLVLFVFSFHSEPEVIKVHPKC